MKHGMKFTALLLLAALLLPACAQNKEPAPADSSGAVTDVQTEPVETVDPNDRANHFDNLPSDLDFGGTEIGILFRGTMSYLDGTKSNFWIINDVCGTDNIGETVSDAVWQRNITVEERLKIKLNWIPTDGTSLSNDQQIIRQSIMSASDEYSCLLATGNSSSGIGLNPYMRDISAIPYIDYSQPWWWEFANEALSMDGKSRQFIVGDMLLTNLNQTGVLYFNKNIYSDIYGDPDEMYRLALDGKLTMDTLYELSSGAYSDANGDGTQNEGDTFGLIWSQGKNEELSHYFVACGLDMYELKDGVLTITMDNERTIAAIEKIYRLMNENEGSWSCTGSLPTISPTFAEGHSLFMMSRFSPATTATLREMEDEYGILPVPKMDADQDRYYSYVHDSGTVLGVPKMVGDEMFAVVGATMEALCGEAHRTYIDAFLETALKMKYSRDALSGQCIDIVMATLTKNTLMEYGNYTASIISTCLYNPAKSNPGTFASAFRKVGPAAQKAWDKAVADMQKADG